jgi:hypothetical protein
MGSPSTVSKVQHVDVSMDDDVPKATNPSPIHIFVPSLDPSDSCVADSAIVYNRQSKAP